MAGGGGDAPPPVDDGVFLLQLLQNPPHRFHQPQSPAQPPPPPTTQILTHDPAVAAFGPTVPNPFPQQLFSSNGLVPPSHPWPHAHLHQSPLPYAPHSFFLQSPNPSSSQVFPAASPPGFSQGNFLQNNAQFKYNSSGDGVRKLGLLGTDSNTSSAHQQDVKDLVFGTLRASEEGFLTGNYSENLLASQEDKRNLGISLIKEKKREVCLEDIEKVNGFGVNFQQSSVDQNSRANSSVLRGHGQERSGSSRRGTSYWGKQGHNFSNHRATVPPPGFTAHQMSVGGRAYPNRKENFDHYRESRHRSGKDEMERRFSSRDGDRGLSRQLDRLGPPAGSKLHSVPASDFEESMMAYHTGDGETHKEFGNRTRDTKGDIPRSHDDLDDLKERLVDSLGLEDESDEKSDQKKDHGTRDRVSNLWRLL